MRILILFYLIIIYYIFKIIKVFSKIELSDLLSIISIIVDISMPIIIAYYLQNKFLINRNLKTYHINLCDQILKDYKLFIDEIIKGELNRREINNKFKSFSIGFNFIDKSNSRRFNSNVNLQPINRKIQIIITNSPEFNSTVTNSKVKLKSNTISAIYLEYAHLLNTNGDLIFVLNN